MVAQERALTWCDVFAPHDDPTTVEKAAAVGRDVTSLLARADGAVVVTCGVPHDMLSGASGGGTKGGGGGGGNAAMRDAYPHVQSQNKSQGQGQGQGQSEGRGQELGDGHDGPNGDGSDASIHSLSLAGEEGGRGGGLLRVRSPHKSLEELSEDFIGDVEGMAMMVGIPTGMMHDGHNTPTNPSYRNSDGDDDGHGGDGGVRPTHLLAGAQGVVLARRPSDPQCRSSTGSHQVICLASEPLLGARWVGSEVRTRSSLHRHARYVLHDPHPTSAANTPGVPLVTPLSLLLDPRLPPTGTHTPDLSTTHGLWWRCACDGNARLHSHARPRTGW